MSLWTQPKHPGDKVRSLTLYRNFAIGEICIQAFNARSFRVAAFLPGVNAAHPGDTPNMTPEQSCYRSNTYAADEAFDLYVQEAYAAGWQNYVKGS